MRGKDPVEQEIEAAIDDACWREDNDAAHEFSLMYGEYQRHFKIPPPQPHGNGLILDIEGGTYELRRVR